MFSQSPPFSTRPSGTDIAFRVYGVICLLFMGLFIYLNQRYQQQQEQQQLPVDNNNRGSLRVDDPRQFINNSPLLAPHGAPINPKWQTKYSSGLKAGIRQDPISSTSKPVRYFCCRWSRFAKYIDAFSSIIQRWPKLITVTIIMAIDKSLVLLPLVSQLTISSYAFHFVIRPLDVLLFAAFSLRQCSMCLFAFSQPQQTSSVLNSFVFFATLDICHVVSFFVVRSSDRKCTCRRRTTMLSTHRRENILIVLIEIEK